MRFPRLHWPRLRSNNTVVHFTVNVAGALPTVEQLQRMQREAEKLL